MPADNFIYHEFLLTLPEERRALKAFLKQHGLQYEADLEFACGYLDGHGHIVSCGGCSGNVLKCFAVEECLRGNNILGKMITHLVAERFSHGFSRLLVFTRPQNTAAFCACGFFPVAQTSKAAMLENIVCGVPRYIASLKAKVYPDSGAIVMNGNPFSLGHLALIEYAAQRCSFLHIFVLEENLPVFPFAVRYDLVKRGTEHLSNVQVHAGGPYIISKSTFPTYFLKLCDDATAVQAALDCTLFAEKIAPPLKISTRFVGQEPFCETTDRYNAAMEDIFPFHGITVAKIPRIRADDGSVISASLVRKKLWRQPVGSWLRSYVPDVTYDYLCSAKAEPVLEKLRNEQPTHI